LKGKTFFNFLEITILKFYSIFTPRLFHNDSVDDQASLGRNFNFSLHDDDGNGHRVLVTLRER